MARRRPLTLEVALAPEVRAGVSLSLSGPFRLQGEQARKGLQLWVDWVNAAGGLPLGPAGSRRPLRLLVFDDKSSTSLAKENVLRFLTQDHVDLLIGPYSSGLTLAVAPLAEAHGKILWNHGGASDAIFQGSWRYLVSVPSPASDYLKALPLLVRSQDPSIARISVVYAKTGSFAAHVARGVADVAAAAGFDVIRLIPFDSPIRDAGALLREALAAEPDLLVGAGSFQDDVVIVRCLDLASRVKTLAFVGAGLEAFYGEVGALAEGVIGPSQWEPAADDGPLTGPNSEGNNSLDSPNPRCYASDMDTYIGPETLVEAIRYFADPDKCLSYMVGLRWPAGVACPTCGSRAVTFLSTRRVWKCREDHPRRQFSIKVGTVFEDSPIGLDKWLPAMWMLVNDKNGISSYEVARALGVTQRTAWFMLHRIRLVVQTGTFAKLAGDVEADETFIGGAARFMHKGKKAERLGGKRGGMVGKIAVMGLLERHGPDKTSRVRLSVVSSTRRGPLQDTVRKHVAPGANLYTDALKSYEGLAGEYTHKVIDHAESYVKGKVHTNGLENFWSLLKRSIKGTYVSVEPFHLFRYLDEQAYRFNTRRGTDRTRFVEALRAILGKRLTYNDLTGASLATT